MSANNESKSTKGSIVIQPNCTLICRLKHEDYKTTDMSVCHQHGLMIFVNEIGDKFGPYSFADIQSCKISKDFKFVIAVTGGRTLTLNGTRRAVCQYYGALWFWYVYMTKGEKNLPWPDKDDPDE
jgi:hypothetical protein